MSDFRKVLTLLGLLFTTAELRAQVLLVPNPYVASGGIFYAHGGRHNRLTLGYSYGYWSPYFAGPYGYNSINSVTIVYAAPPLTPPRFLVPQPIMAQPFAGGGGGVLRLDDLGRLDPTLNTTVPPSAVKKPEGDQPLPGGRDAGVFRPLAPDNRARAQRPIPEEQPRKLAPPPVPFNPAAELPKPAQPNVDPKAEAQRQMQLGRTAFAAKEYGRAAQFFRAAIKQAPEDARFLLAQALFAAGRYIDAVDAIRAGVALRPDWPKTPFAPRDLYGPNAAEYNDHLRRLRDALDALPDDPTLLFLNAYQLWFDGRKDEARPLFRRARPKFADPAIIDRFLA